MGSTACVSTDTHFRSQLRMLIVPCITGSVLTEFSKLMWPVVIMLLLMIEEDYQSVCYMWRSISLCTLSIP